MKLNVKAVKKVASLTEITVSDGSVTDSIEVDLNSIDAAATEIAKWFEDIEIMVELPSDTPIEIIEKLEEALAGRIINVGCSREGE